MKRWSLDFSLAAEKDLAGFDSSIRRRIIDKLDWLLVHFESILPSVLTGEFREFYKLRVGDWRVMYKVDWKNHTITVSYIEHRGRGYKKK